MPAGDYEVRSYSNGLALFYQLAGSHEATSSITFNVGNSRSDTEGKLTFHRYGTQYFLTQISRGNGNLISGLSRSRAERELMKVAQSRPVETVTVATLRVGR